MRTDFGWDAKYIDSLDERELANTFQLELFEREKDQRHEANLPAWIAAGYISQTDADALSRRGLRRFANKVGVLESHTAMMNKEQKPVTKHNESTPAAIANLSRAELLTLHAGTVAVMAAMQAQIDELRDEVVVLRNSNLAVFGEQQVIAQLTSVQRNFEGVDVTMTLEEQSSDLEESSGSSSKREHASLESASDAAAGIEGLASLVAGLNVGRTANLNSLNEVARKMSARSRVQVRTRSKGTVRVKIAKVTGGIDNAPKPHVVASGTAEHESPKSDGD